MAEKDDIFGSFIDNLEQDEKPPKKGGGLLSNLFSGKKNNKSSQQKSSESSDSFYDESMDFLSADDSGNLYNEPAESSSLDSGEEFVPTLRNLFGFKWWEFGVIVIEVLLIVYMVLVLLKVVPLF